MENNSVFIHRDFLLSVRTQSFVRKLFYVYIKWREKQKYYEFEETKNFISLSIELIKKRAKNASR